MRWAWIYWLALALSPQPRAEFKAQSETDTLCHGLAHLAEKSPLFSSDFTGYLQSQNFTVSHGTDAESADIKAFVRRVVAGKGLKVNLDGDLDQVGTYYTSHKGHLAVVRNAEGQIIGTSGYRMIDSSTVELKRVYLDPQVQGRGLGKRMVTIMIEDARSNGFAKMELRTSPQSTEAIALYTKLGFVLQPARSIDGKLIFELTL